MLRDEENKQRLREQAYDQEHVTDAAATVMVLGNTDPAAHADRVFEDWLDKGYLPDEETRDGLIDQVEGWRERQPAENRVWTARSTALAGMTLMYAAWEMGIASGAMEGFDKEGVREEFDIGEGYEPVMLVTLGYPEEDADDIEGPRRLRRPVGEMTHFETFDPDSEGEPAEKAMQAEASADDDWPRPGSTRFDRPIRHRRIDRYATLLNRAIRGSSNTVRTPRRSRSRSSHSV